MSDSAGTRFDRLVGIMRALRAPDGCPWDREQTQASLRPFVLEETYEVLEAIESGDVVCRRPCCHLDLLEVTEVAGLHAVAALVEDRVARQRRALAPA